MAVGSHSLWSETSPLVYLLSIRQSKTWDEKKRLAVALANLDEAFALFFAVESATPPKIEEELGLRKIRDAYKVFFDGFPPRDAREGIYGVSNGDSDFLQEIYSELVTRIGL